MQRTGAPARSARELLDANRRYYDMLWSGARLIEPRCFNTWPLVQSLLPGAGARLEVGPGLRLRLPLEDTQFVDISGAALEKLRERGASVVRGPGHLIAFCRSIVRSGMRSRYRRARRG